MGLGTGAAPPAPLDLRGGLDADDEFGLVLGDLEHPERRSVPSVPQPDEYRRGLSELSFSSQSSNNRNDGGTPGPIGDRH